MSDGGNRILVVEDSRTQAMRLEFLLEQEGYAVTICENGRDALAAARQYRPALVISDIVMPEMDGYTLCRALKDEAELAAVPVLLVTTLADPQDVLRGLDCGADGFIVKPFEEGFLLNRVRLMLMNRKIRVTERADMGLNLTLYGQKHFITSDRLQILNLLLSTFEAATQRSAELQRSDEQLRCANAALREANEHLREQIRQREVAEAEVLRLNRQLLTESEARLQHSENRLREQEALLWLAGQMARVGGWSYRPADRHLYLSDHAAAIHEAEPGHAPTLEEAIAAYTPASRAEMRSAFEACCRNGTAFDIEAQLLTLRGRPIAVRTMGRAHRDATGAIVRIEGALQDTTERQQARERVHHLARRLTTTLETMSDAFFMLDHAWRFTYLNGEAERILQRERAALIGEELWGEFPQALGTAFEGRYREAMATAKAVTFEAHYAPLDIWLEVRAYPSPEGLAVNFSDVSERRRSSEERREQALLLEKAKDAIVVHDLRQRVTFWNAAAERLYGWPHAEAIGRSIVDLVYAGNPAQYDIAHDALLRNGEWSGRVRQSARDGRVLAIEGHWTLLRDETGEPTAALVINTDVSDKVELEQRLAQAQKLESIGQLTGGIAHDFNNFLTVIIGSAQLLVEALNEDGRLAPLASMVLKAGERGARLTGQLLAFARRQALEPELARVGELIDGMRDLLEGTLGADIGLTIEHPPGLPPVMIDVAQFESALLNLCINARDAMPYGGRLLIEAMEVLVDHSRAQDYPELDPGDYVSIAVSDSGAGMAADVLAQAFEPFFTTKERGKGTGLGLSTIYGFAKQSGGHVTIYSEPGEGTTIRLYLPGMKGKAPSSRSDLPTPAAGGAGESILLVDDDALVREQAHCLLRDLGYEVLVATNGPEALGILASAVRIDLLFTDVVMPGGMNGLELARRALLLRPDLPVLYASGYTEQAMVQRGGGHGLNLLHKPYWRDTLARKIRGTLAASVVARGAES